LRSAKMASLGLHQLFRLFYTTRKGRKDKLIGLQCTDINYEHLN